MMNQARAAACATAALAATLTASSGSAQLDVRSIASPGGYVQVGATTVGESFSTALGDDLRFIFEGSGDVFDEAQFAGSSVASRSVSTGGGTNTSFASGSVVLGSFGLAASQSSTANGFVMGEATAGFQDSFTVTANDVNAQGFMVFTMAVTGNLVATGTAGRATVEIGVFKDGVRVEVNDFHDDGQSNNIFVTGFQQGFYQASTDSANPSDQFIVNDVVTFSIPVTAGETFDLAVVGKAVGGKRSSLNSSSGSTGDASFANTFTWTGITGIVDADGNAIAGAAVTAASGLDYTGFVPAPGGMLMIAGLAGLSVTRRRR